MTASGAGGWELMAEAGDTGTRGQEVASGRGIGAPGEGIECDFRVRYAETDSMGYLHHAKYWEYFEHARTELLRQNGYRYRDLEREGVLFVVYKASCRYLGPIRYDDLVKVQVVVDRITRTRVDHSYSVFRDGERLTEATSTLACVGVDGLPRLMPDSLWGQR
jgi:acyl-CoA thioester hydrolase